MPYRLIPFVIAFGVFLLDRITKDVVRSHVSAWETLRVIPGFFNIVHAENPGVAFGLLADSTSPWRNVLLIGLSALVLVFVMTMLWRGRGPENWLLRVGLALVLGGALGNLLDRVANGTVTDFVEVYSGQHYFPAFNVADSAISIGAALLLLEMLRGRGKKLAMDANEPG